MDRLHLDYPFAGARMLREMLKAKGCRMDRRATKRNPDQPSSHICFAT
jgi:putative transposase